MRQVINQVLANSDRAILATDDSVPTIREVRLARALHVLAKDLHPDDPRNALLDEICEDAVA